MKIERKSINELKPWERNPRVITERAFSGLQASIERFGLVEPIIWNEATGRVVGGHQRLQVLRRQGVEETDVVVVSLSDEDERALNVALNNPMIMGQFDDSIGQLLDEIKEADEELYVSAGFKDMLESKNELLDFSLGSGDIEEKDLMDRMVIFYPRKNLAAKTALKKTAEEVGGVVVE